MPQSPSSASQNDANSSSSSIPSINPQRRLRHAEKRRTATCSFANHVANASREHYRQLFRESSSSPQGAVVMASIVVHDETRAASVENTPNLSVVSMGVGTKFLPESVLREEHNNSGGNDLPYGCRMRDCHAEVLARRGLKRRLLEEVVGHIVLLYSQQEQEKSSSSLPQQPINTKDRDESQIRLLEAVPSTDSSLQQRRPKFRLRPGLSLHFYTSSAPCGNAVLKKFATLEREVFHGDIGWRPPPHSHIPGHSVSLGQFSLLCKADKSSSCATSGETGSDADHAARHKTHEASYRQSLPKKQRQWPVHTSTDWCPPGTIPVWNTQGGGSLHTCSDKLLRWNILGLQGTLLASWLQESPNAVAGDQNKKGDNDRDCTQPSLSPPPRGIIFVSSLTVGRKFSNVCTRRAVCCRGCLPSSTSSNQLNETSRRSQGQSSAKKGQHKVCCNVNHPAIMGTDVYLDDRIVEEQEATRFWSHHCWIWWLGLETPECIDGRNGFLVENVDDSNDNSSNDKSIHETKPGTPIKTAISLASSWSCLSLLSRIEKLQLNEVRTLEDYNVVKQTLAPSHDALKESVFRSHPVLKDWKRKRCYPP